jgi:hypothetical protein
VLTPQEVHAFNEKAQKFGQTEALQVTWGHEEPVALSLTLRAIDRAIRHTRMILRAKGVRGLRLYPDRVDVRWGAFRFETLLTAAGKMPTSKCWISSRTRHLAFTAPT